jgi:SAM-dependent methyltransferase
MRALEADPALVERLHRDALPGAVLDARDVRAHALRCERLLAALAPRLPRGRRARVLEVGLGAGYVIAALRWRFGDGLELYAVEHPARALLTDPGFPSYLRQHAVAFEPADLLTGRLDAFRGLQFDAIVCSEVIEHLAPPAVPEALRSLGARLAYAGVLLLSSPNLRSFHRRASFALGSGRILDLPLRLSEADGTYGHLRLYSRGEIDQLLARTGLELVAWEYVNFEAAFVEGRVLRAAQTLLPLVLPPLSSGWLAVARSQRK